MLKRRLVIEQFGNLMKKKKSTDIEDLIVQRQEAEQEIAAIDRRIADNSTLGKVLQARLKKKMGEFDEKPNKVRKEE